jgi:ATP-dependent Clp protease ATP-binding subunit ClpC
LTLARDEAELLHHEYVGTEHILLGLLRFGNGVANVVMQNLGADPGRVRDGLLGIVRPGRSHSHGPDLPYTSRAKKSLELAMVEAQGLNHSYVGTEHLLLGLMREEKGIAAQALVDAGITLERAREETLRVLGGDDDILGAEFETHGMASTAGRAVNDRAPAESGPWRRIPEWLRVVLLDAYARAEARGINTATVADLLEAVIRSSPAVASAFTSREIDIDALIADVRAQE